jgi:Helix-turn-helix domain
MSQAINTEPEFKPHNIAGFDQHYTTTEAAAILRVKPQTLRKWACFDNGPVKPIRRNGRLLWPGAGLHQCLQG